MRRISLTYLSWAALLLAVALWVGVGFFVRAIGNEESARAERAFDTQEETVRQSAILRLRALARDTKEARAKLEEIAQQDIVSIVESIETMGRDAKVAIEIGEAIPGAPFGSSSAIRSVAFAVEAEGSFAQVMQVAALLGSLPIPSTLDEVHFEQLTASSGSAKSKAGAWRVVARLHFLTSIDLSS